MRIVFHWHYVEGYRSNKHGHRIFRDGRYGVQKEVLSSYNKRSHKWGKSKESYFIDGDTNEYKTESDLSTALQKGD